MSGIKDYADGLHQDVVSDIAESYFGARKDLEDMITAYGQMVSDFRPMVARLNQATATLHLLLLDENTASDFYIALGITPACLLFAPSTEAKPDLGGIPFAFTLKKRYEKCVLRAYDRLQRVSDEYLNGRYYDDPEQTGRKRLTVHYLRLRALAGDINEEVHKVNNEISTTGVLRYVKGMDPEQMERENIMGGMSLAEGSNLDKDLFFEPVDFAALNLPEVQELPPLKSVRDTIRAFCRKIFAANREAVAWTVKELGGISSHP